MRQSLKRVAEHVLAYGGASSLGRVVHRADAVVLSYHNIVPDGGISCGDRPLHLARSEFARQLDELARTHDVISLDSLTSEHARESRRPRAAITFDDAYVGALEYGLAELAQRGLPATVFVAPGFVGGRTFWWDDVADQERGLTSDRRRHALTALAGRDASIREWLGIPADARRDIPPHMRCATEQQLRRAADLPGVTLGVHTWSHPNLAALVGMEVESELTRARDWLRARFASYVDWVAYPYGLKNSETEAVAKRLGFRGGLITSGGWLRATHDEFSRPRVDIPAGVSTEGFVLRAAGLAGTRAAQD